MALRIAGNKKPSPMPEEVPVEAAPEASMPNVSELPDELAGDAPADDATENIATGGTLDPMIARYKGPEDGPFMCGSCVHFSASGPNTCAIVSGYIDEGGICNVFTPLQETPAEEPAPEKLPTEEAAPLPQEAPIEEAPPQP